ncbi:MAG: hypothetical protein ACHQJD_06125 [Thermoanaerobaculia bacterium]
MSWLSPAAYLSASAGALFCLGGERPATALGAALAVVACLALGVLVSASQAPLGQAAGGDMRIAWSVLALTLAMLAAFLFMSLTSYSGILMTWEGPVISGFEADLRVHTTLPAFALQRLLWNRGLLSMGQDSLFYGLPTFTLFQVAGISLRTLRLTAAVATLAGVAMAFLFAKRFFDPFTAAALAIVLALSPCVLFYARYGSSVAGMLVAVWIALWGACHFLVKERPTAIDGALCAGGAYLATLQYATGRLVALFLLGFVPLFVVFRRRRPRPWAGVAVFLVLAAGTWLAQRRFDRDSWLLAVRGEQLLGFLKHPDSLRDYLGRSMTPADVTWRDRVELAGRLIRSNAPAYADLVLPRKRLNERGGSLWSDPGPLPLHFASSLPLILWGLALSLRQLSREGRHLILVVGALTISVPLLLTNRADLPRLSCLVPFFAVWAALGLAAGWRTLQSTAVPRAVQILLAAGLAFGSGWAAYGALSYAGPPPPAPVAAALEQELATIEGPLQLGVLAEQRDLCLIRLPLLDRLRHQLHFPPTLIEHWVRDGLIENPASHPRAVERLAELSTEAPVLLGPADRFEAARPLLAARGLTITPGGTSEFPLLRVESDHVAGPPPDR